MGEMTQRRKEHLRVLAKLDVEDDRYFLGGSGERYVEGRGGMDGWGRPVVDVFASDKTKRQAEQVLGFLLGLGAVLEEEAPD